MHPLQAIYKYKLEPTDVQKVELPRGAQILSTEVIDGSIFVWALVTPDEEETEWVHVFIIGTGHPITHSQIEKTRFLGTVLMPTHLSGTLVWHVWVEN